MAKTIETGDAMTTIAGMTIIVPIVIETTIGCGEFRGLTNPSFNQSGESQASSQYKNWDEAFAFSSNKPKQQQPAPGSETEYAPGHVRMRKHAPPTAGRRLVKTSENDSKTTSCAKGSAYPWPIQFCRLDENESALGIYES